MCIACMILYTTLAGIVPHWLVLWGFLYCIYGKNTTRVHLYGHVYWTCVLYVRHRLTKLLDVIGLYTPFNIVIVYKK